MNSNITVNFRMRDESSKSLQIGLEWDSNCDEWNLAYGEAVYCHDPEGELPIAICKALACERDELTLRSVLVSEVLARSRRIEAEMVEESEIARGYKCGPIRREHLFDAPSRAEWQGQKMREIEACVRYAQTAADTVAREERYLSRAS